MQNQIFMDIETKEMDFFRPLSSVHSSVFKVWTNA